MRKLTFFSSTPKDFKVSSTGIRWHEYGLYSAFSKKATHIGIILESEECNPNPFKKIFHAAYGDVNCLTLDNFLEKNHMYPIGEIHVPERLYFEIEEWLWDKLQKPYSKIQLVQILFGLEKEGSPKSFICTELVARLIEDKLGYNITNALDTIGIVECISIIKDFQKTYNERI